MMLESLKLFGVLCMQCNAYQKVTMRIWDAYFAQSKLPSDQTTIEFELRNAVKEFQECEYMLAYLHLPSFRQLHRSHTQKRDLNDTVEGTYMECAWTFQNLASSKNISRYSKKALRIWLHLLPVCSLWTDCSKDKALETRHAMIVIQKLHRNAILIVCQRTP